VKRFRPTDDELIALALNDDRLDARAVAELWKSGHVKEALAYLEVVGSPRILRLVADAREGKPLLKLTKLRLNLMRAYATYRADQLLEDGVYRPPTCTEVRKQWKRLYRWKSPDNRVIRRTLTKELGWPLSPDVPGRPRKIR
jgi:hypothetical protein